MVCNARINRDTTKCRGGKVRRRMKEASHIDSVPPATTLLCEDRATRHMLIKRWRIDDHSACMPETFTKAQQSFNKGETINVQDCIRFT